MINNQLIFDCFRFFFGIEHPKYADSLSDYGFLLLSVDSVGHAVKFYKVSLTCFNSKSCSPPDEFCRAKC